MKQILLLGIVLILVSSLVTALEYKQSWDDRVTYGNNNNITWGSMKSDNPATPLQQSTLLNQGRYAGGVTHRDVINVTSAICKNITDNWQDTVTITKFNISLTGNSYILSSTTKWYPITSDWLQSTVTWNNPVTWDTTNNLVLGKAPAFAIGTTTAFKMNASWLQSVCNKEVPSRGWVMIGDESQVNTITAFCSPSRACVNPSGYVEYTVDAPTTSIPEYIHPTPADNAHNNTQQAINCSHDGTNVKFNLWVDDGLIYDNITGNYTTGIEYFPIFTNGVHTYSCNVQNITDGIFSSNVTRTFTYDDIEPTITILENNWNVDNTSKINSFYTNLTLNVSFYDDNLYQVLINITNSSGAGMFQLLNTTITGSTANYSQMINISTFPLGQYTIKFYASDSHTTQSIEPYLVTKSYDKTQLEYDTAEGTNIKIEAMESWLDIDTFDTVKLKDRYIFNIKYKNIKTERSFKVTSDQPLIYLPDSQYPAHFITGKNWIDFDEYSINKDDVTVKMLNDYEAIVIIKTDKDAITFNSIGGLNINQLDYSFEVTSVLMIHAVSSLDNHSLNFTSYLNDSIMTGNAPGYVTYINVSKGSYILNITSPNYYGISNSVEVTNSSHNLTYYLDDYNVIDNCSVYSNLLFSIYGFDEETLDREITPIDITIFHKSDVEGADSKNLSLVLRGRNNYTICTSGNYSLILNSIMQFGDGVNYAIRNYYINDLSVNSTSPGVINLYSINYTKASEIVMTVFDVNTADRISGTYIKTLRYYPGENILRVVEVSKTDEQGQTLAKLVLADVFYKFQVEYPAGIIKLYTDTQNILALTKSFGLSFIVDYLDTWDKVGDVVTAVVCTQSTNTCSYTWSDSRNIVQDATLEVYRNKGFKTELLYTNTIASSAGVMGYTVVEDTTGNTYTAKGYIESNTGTSNYFTDSDQLIYIDDPFFSNATQRTANLFPLFLLVLVVVFALIDFGTVGVVVGSIIGLLIGAMTKILPLSPYYLISFIIMAIILIYKLTREK